jgi:REP element-mobilizing transposase RayT
VAYHPRIETKEMGNLLTTRSIKSRLWFVNNSRLESACLGYAAKFSKRYSVKLYALAIEGNHIHATAQFPLENRADFMRDLNSCIGRAVPRYVTNYIGGPLWARRYSVEYLPNDPDIEEYFFYVVLQPVQDGLVEKISHYPGYNCFYDAVNGIKRKFKVVNWAAYNAAKRYGNVSIKDFTETVTLEYARVPGYEHLSQKEYSELMHKKLEERRLAIVNAPYLKGKRFLGREKLKLVRAGAMPNNTKKSDMSSHRPRVLSLSDKSRAEGRAWYFDIYYTYKDASERFRKGDMTVTFPPGTYRPYSAYRAPPS